MATLLLSGAPGTEHGSMERPKQNIADRIELKEVHPLLQAVNTILENIDPHMQQNAAAVSSKPRA